MTQSLNFRGDTIFVSSTGFEPYVVKRTDPFSGVDIGILRLVQKKLGFHMDFINEVTWGFSADTGALFNVSLLSK